VLLAALPILVGVGACMPAASPDADGELYVLVREAFGPVGDTGEILRLVAPA
jgi:hypothetical protein